MENTEFAIEMMKQLKNMNLQLLVDDFGTGYSSLSYIQNFPVDMLKIDRSFVNRMSVEEESMGIIQAIIMMARSLGIKVLAEGVENGTQVEKLKSLKCDYAQGYYYSDVLSPEQMENLFEQKNKW
jgi:EAL domain-containing protein (putative c-di-GMP-specific phosphodiesterase class I)